MRIALTHLRHAKTGGTERYLDRLAAFLAARGHAPTIVCRSHAAAPHPAVRFEVLHGLALGGAWRTWSFARAVERHLRAREYDLVFGLGRTWCQDVLRLVAGGRDVQVKTTAPRTIARPETTFLLTNMMRSVMNEGTGAGARAAGFSIDAAGKSGTTNDLRDAWFVGFTPELLTVVWVGMDDNQPVGLSGSQAALPIWTTFMSKALAGRESTSFQTPAGITFLDIDRDTGRVAGPLCPRIFSEAFIAGTEPTEACSLHSWW